MKTISYETSEKTEITARSAKRSHAQTAHLTGGGLAKEAIAVLGAAAPST